MPAREFLAGHRLRAGDAVHAAAMIAPARSRRLRHPARGRGRARRPAGRDRAARGTPARRSRPRAGRRNRHRRAALARRARSPDRRASPKRPLRRLDPEIVEILRLSAYQLLHLTRVPGVGGRRRCGEPGEAGGQAERERLRERGAARDLATAARAAAAAAAGRPDRSRRGARLPEHHALASALARRALVDRLGFDARRSVDAVQQHAGAADAAREPLRNHPRRACRERSPRRRRRAPGDASRPTRSIVDEGHPLRGDGRGRRAVRRAGRSVAARRAARRRSPGARVLDTCASPGGKTTAMAAAMRGPRPDGRVRRARRAHRPAAPHGCAPAAPTNVRIVQADLLQPLPFARRSTACSSTRPAPAWARSGAIPTSDGGGAKRPAVARRRPARRCSARRRCRRARRTADLRDLLERAGGERSGRRRVSRATRRSSRAMPAGDATPRSRRRRRRARPSADRAARPRARGILRRRVRADGRESAGTVNAADLLVGPEL